MRRAQIFSLDALISLVIVVMIISVITSTSETIRGELTSIVSWYDRANIANNMLDVLVNTPGEPENWENSSNIVVIGLRSSTYPYALDYGKLLSLVERVDNNDSVVLNALERLSGGRDFALSFYYTNITLNGTIVAKQVVENVTVVIGETISFTSRITLKRANRGQGYGYGQRYFFVDRLNSYFIINGKVMSIQDAIVEYGSEIVLGPGDSFVFYPPRRGGRGRSSFVVDNGTYVTSVAPGDYQYAVIRVESGTVTVQIGPGGGRWKVSVYIEGNNSQGVVIIAREGEEQVEQVRQVLVSNISLLVTYPTQLTVPSYTFAVINGSFVTDPLLIYSSKNASSWVEYAEVRMPIVTLIYNKNYTLTPAEVPKLLIAGQTDQILPYYGLKITPNGIGNATLVAWTVGEDGVLNTIIVVNKTSETGTIQAKVYYSNGESVEILGTPEYVVIPWNAIFQSPEYGQTVSMSLWVYSIDGFSSVTFEDTGSLDALMKPKFESGVIKIWVWDDS
ncbi:hypothetical protein QDY65_00185 [Pyrococcus kukulkanii]|uniref:hypothetical protein n=1 Tax=Pyrococcus kukulkanii TaxID=1609559 RepID=UPI00356933BF